MAIENKKTDDNIIQFNNTITKEEVKQVSDTIESLPKSEETKIMQEIANGDKPEKEEGFHKDVIISPNHDTGESVIVSNKSEDKKIYTEDDIPEDMSSMTDEEFSDFIDNFEAKSIEYTVTPEDIKKNSETSIVEVTLDNISDIDTLELVKLVNRKKHGETIRYNELPDTVKKIIDESNIMMSISHENKSNEANRIRNIVADRLITEYNANIGMSKFSESINNEIMEATRSTTEELSPLFKAYNYDTRVQLESMMSKTEDSAGKEKAQKVLDSINDAFDLTSLKELAPKTKIKKFDIEKPNRVFFSIHQKFDKANSSIYDLFQCTTILARHIYFDQLIKDKQEARDIAIKIMILFCKQCLNYKAENPNEYAYMYYFTYNIFLLDLYKADEYKSYTECYYANLKEVIDAMK